MLLMLNSETNPNYVPIDIKDFSREVVKLSSYLRESWKTKPEEHQLKTFNSLFWGKAKRQDQKKYM